MEIGEDRLWRRRGQEAADHIGVGLIEECRGGAGAKRAVAYGLDHTWVELEGVEESQCNSFNCCTKSSNAAISIGAVVVGVVGAVAIGTVEVVGEVGVVSAKLGREVVGDVRHQVGNGSRLLGQ